MKKSLGTLSITTLAVLFVLSACSKGPQGPSGPVGSSYPAPTQACSNPSHKGVTLTTSLDSRAAGMIVANAVTITTATTAISLSVYTSSGPVTGQIRMALYGDNGSNSPGNLMAETIPLSPALNTWNTADIPDTYLPPGVYWQAVNYSNQNDYAGTYVNSGTLKWLTGYGWSEFPPVFGAPTSTNSSAQLSMYINLCP